MHEPARTIVPFDDLVLDEVAEAPMPPPRTPVPVERVIPFPTPSTPPSRLADPLDAPDAVEVFLRQAGLLDDDEAIEIVTDSAPPVRSSEGS